MKICFVTEFYNPSYGGQYSSLKGLVDQCKVKKIKYFIVHKKSKIYHNNLLLKKVFASCDIIHIFGGWTYFYVRMNLLALKLQKKVIIHPMGFYEPWSLSQNKIKKFIAWNLYQKNLLLKADLIHCASKIEEKNLKKLNKKFKTIVLPFGINNKFIKKKNNIKINKKALFFSRLHKKKGLDILIRAWLSVGNNDWSLDIAGPGDYKKYINKVASTKKNIKINFIKPVYKNHQKIELFNKYDFLVLPTENENFGLVILESIARGVPVLTTNRCPWESLQKYNAGWVINFSYLELKLVLNKIFQMTKKEFFLKKKNSTKLASKFALEKLFNKYIAVYNKFI